MEMVGQKHISQHRKRVELPDVIQNFAQQADILWITKNGFAVLDNLCDENRRARDIITAKVHARIIRRHT